MKRLFFLTIVLLNYFFLFAQLKINPEDVPTGILIDLRPSLSTILKFDGHSFSVANPTSWLDIYQNLYSCSVSKILPQDIISITYEANCQKRKNIYPIHVLDFNFNSISSNAIENNFLEIKDNQIIVYNPQKAFETLNTFTAACISKRTYYKKVNFTLDKKYFFSNNPNKLLYFLIDFDDGKGFKNYNFGDTINIFYSTEGKKIIKLVAIYENNESKKAFFEIDIKDSNMPNPSEYFELTADLPYNSEFAQGNVAIFYGFQNTHLTEPVIIVDGFDPGDTQPIEKLYELANQQNLIDSLRNLNMDVVLLNFYDGAGYIQKNAMLFIKLINYINSQLTLYNSPHKIVVIGPSMGGLITRYALRYIELNNGSHNVRTWISFDSPQKGANIPLGVQHWVRFFAEEVNSAGAILAKNALNQPAALQQLIYHYTATNNNSANPSEQRINFVNELNVIGFPQKCRRVAIINGSGFGNGQPFAPGQKVINYEYSSWQVSLKGNVWAVNNNTNTKIFEGLYDPIWPLFFKVEENIFVNNTLPYDGAPGGQANTFAVLDSNDTGGYGDIIALYPNHCFIPTISSLCIENYSDPYLNVNDNLTNIQTPFNAIYFPSENQDHVLITTESKNWFKKEVYNFPPFFTSRPLDSVLVNEQYFYKISVADSNYWDNLSVSAETLPSWLSLDTVSLILVGIPSETDTGMNFVSLKVSDGYKHSYQNFFIYVKNPVPMTINLSNNIDNVIITDKTIFVNSQNLINLFLYDISGKLIDKFNSNIINISHLKAGIYLATIYFDKKTEVFKIILR